MSKSATYHLSTFEAQLTQLEQLVCEKDRNIAPCLLNSIPISIQTPDISEFPQVNPVSIPSDSTSDYPIQFESEPTPNSLSQHTEFEHERPSPTIFPHVDNRSTLEQCLAEILRADELEQSNHQMNQTSIPSDSIPDYHIPSESESLFHFSSAPEFDIEELNTEDIHDLETIFQTLEPSINPYLLDFMIQDPTRKSCTCLDEWSNDDLNTLAQPLTLHDKTSEDVRDDDELHISSDHVNIPSDYPIYDSTPDDPFFDPSPDDSCYEIDESHTIFPPFYEPSTIPFFQDFFSGEPIYDDDSLITNLKIHTHSEKPLDYICDDVSVNDELVVVFDHVETVVRWESFLMPGSQYITSAREEIFDDVLEIQVDLIKDIYIELQDVQDFFINIASSARRKVGGKE